MPMIKDIEDIHIFVKYGFYFIEWSGKYLYFMSAVKDIFNKNIWIFFLLYKTNLTKRGKFHSSQANSYF